MCFSNHQEWVLLLSKPEKLPFQIDTSAFQPLKNKKKKKKNTFTRCCRRRHANTVGCVHVNLHPRAKVHGAAFREIRLAAAATVLLTHVSLFPLREPDVPAWAPLLYQLQLLDARDKPDPTALPVADRIRIGNQKRERGNFHFQREEYCLAARAYSVALSVLTTRGGGTASR